MGLEPCGAFLNTIFFHSMDAINTLKKKLFDIKTIVFILIVILSVIRLKKEGELYPTGDAVEYTIMTEALYDHFLSNYLLCNMPP